MKDLRKTIIKAAYESKEGHIPSALSVLDLLWVLYSGAAKSFPQEPKNPERDIIILSKGHASLGLYAVLAEKGFFSKDLLAGFARFDSILGGHPDRNKVPGVEASTGSLGHGLPMAVGFALGFKISGKNNRVFTIVGDGEANEGTIWGISHAGGPPSFR